MQLRPFPIRINPRLVWTKTTTHGVQGRINIWKWLKKKRGGHGRRERQAAGVLKKARARAS